MNELSVSPETHAHSASKKTPRILLVEDYPSNILVATTLLDMMGAAYEVARNGSEAVEKSGEDTFDLILMDVQMPLMNGIDATQHIRERERERASGGRVPIIGVTAHALKGDRDLCMQCGMDDYISKPFSFEELDSKIKQWSAKSAELVCSP